MGLGVLEIVMAVEDHFAIELPDDVLMNCNTLSELHGVIVAMLAARGTSPSAELDAQVYQDLTRIIAEMTQIASSEIRPDTRLFDVAKD